MTHGTLTPELELSLERPTGIWGWTTTTDHKRIGLLYTGTGLVFFLLAVGFAMVMRTQTMRPRQEIVSPETYNQLFSMHGTIMIFLFAMPVLIGLANYLVPLMIGAKDMAFPRMNALSYWAFLFGAILLLSSFVFGGGALDTGWFSYAPLTQKAYSVHDGVTFWALAILLLGASSLLGAVNFVVTMLKLRAPGMGFFRMPLFCVATFLNSFLIIMAIPSLTAAVAMLYLDRTFGTVFFKPDEGGDPLIWQHLFWFFGHPEVYILIVPAFGIMSEVVPVFSRKPLFGRFTMVIMLLVIGFLSFIVWAHHMFASGLPNSFNAVMAGTSMLIAIPTGVKIFNWLATMWGGSLRFNTPLLFTSGFIAMFTIGGITGVTVAVVPFDWQVTDTYYIVAHLHNVLFPGTLFAVFAGFYYWFPKMTGRFLDDRIGKVHFWLILAGFSLTFLPTYALGLMGMPRRVYTYADDVGWTTLNTISTFGGYLIAAAVLIFFANIVISLRRPATAGPDPWDAWTLEWAAPSPPPHGNFASLPPIRSERPLWDLKHPEHPEAEIAEDLPVEDRPKEPPSAVAEAHEEPDEAAFHSLMPIFAAVCILGIAIGLLGLYYISILSGLVLLIVMYGWMRYRWPAVEKPAMPGERFHALSTGMLVFLASEAALFGSLIYAYIHLRLHSMEWPPPGQEPPEIGFPAINTVVLLSSGVTAHYALTAYRKARVNAYRILLAATVILGAAFLGGQAYEYTVAGFGLSDGILASSFFTLTGFHGAHVTGGLLLLGYMGLRTSRDRRERLGVPERDSEGMLAAGTYYWHFVDAVWVVLFVVLYLL